MLTPDFCGDLDAVARVLDAGPHVFNHNMETVPRLYRTVRPQADYRQSLDVLRFAQAVSAGGSDEVRRDGRIWARRREEVAAVVARSAGRLDVDVATLGQYLQPTRRNLRVAEYVTPEQFEEYRDFGLSIGFKMVFSGPLVRSSYMARSGERRSAPSSRELRSFHFLRGLLILIFPRFDWTWLAPVALTPMLVACARERSWKRRFLDGWAGGFVFWFGVCYWIQFVLEVHGGLGDGADGGRSCCSRSSRACTWRFSRRWRDS